MATPAVDEIMAVLEKERAEAEAKAEIGIGSITDLLAVSGVDKVTISFDGSGDSGQIDEVSPVDGQGVFVTLAPVLNEEIEEWVYEVLEGIGVDWYNNEGGFGNITIDVKGRSYTYEVSQYEMTSSVAAVGTRSVDNGED